jgi:hypothetical protein
VLRLDADGQLLGAVQLGGPGEQGMMGLALSPGGDLVVSGWFDGPFTVGASGLVPEDAHDGFVLRLSPAFEPRWAQRLGGAGEQWIQAVALDEAGAVLAGSGAASGGISLLVLAP